MLALIDTCSLLRLCQYYIPFDRDNKLQDFLSAQYYAKNLQIIDAVYEESSYMQKGKILKTLSFIKRDECPDTSELSISKRISNMIDNQFCNKLIKKKLERNFKDDWPTLYDQQKQIFMKSGDFRLILFAEYIKRLIGNDLFKNEDEALIVTDESTSENDGKLFRKLPNCCQESKLEHLCLVDYLKVCKVEIDWKIPERQ